MNKQYLGHFFCETVLQNQKLTDAELNKSKVSTAPDLYLISGHYLYRSARLSWTKWRQPQSGQLGIF